MPDPLIAQLPLIKDLLAALRVPTFQVEGYEAEDLLATITKRISADVEVFLVTGDKDLLQLVGPRVKVYNPHADNGAILDGEAVKARYGIGPEGMVDFLALSGDEIDNIPGVPGIGPKTASQLLQQFGTVERLYDHLEELPSESQRTALARCRDQVSLARELAQITAEAPIEVGLDDLAVQEPDWMALRRLYRSLEFKKLLAEVDAAMPADPQPTLRAHVVGDQRTADELAKRLASREPAALAAWSTQWCPNVAGDAEGRPPAAGRSPVEGRGRQAESRGGRTRQMLVALAWTAEEAWIVPFDATPPSWLKSLRDWLASAQHPKVGHDVKRLSRLLRAGGCEVDGVAGDTMIAAYLLNPSLAEPSLSDLAEERLGRRLAPLEQSSSLTGLADHACAILQVHEGLVRDLRAAALEALYRELELPLVQVLAEMETTGIAVDRGQLASLRAQMDVKRSRLSRELHELAGCEFNLNSPKQLAEVLFSRLKLPVVKRTKTGPSTDSEVLQKLSDTHPLPKKLIEYRELAKLSSTYLEALPELIDPKTGRLHTTFHQTGTATGRLSSSEPNLQNIPIKTELGRQVRRAFVPGEHGWVLIAADYSQIELRILAHLSGDPALGEAFRQEHYIHRYTASLIYGVEERDVTAEMRGAMKAINYGILYGMSPFGLAKELGIPQEEAAAFIEAYFARYPNVRAFLDGQIEQARRDGFVQTLLGRRRYIPEVTSPDPVTRQFGERMAVNAPIQGSAADLIKQAMVQLHHWLRAQGLKSRMILQVHDELVFEAPPKEREALVGQARRIMEHAIELSVPLRVLVKTGPNWLDMNPADALPA
ncbi:MAG: DNA polymerase I [Candidatus Omnitrophica bacterium]|nr:DNA polymerase I [Candidatus Omnitrophota bacterium]